MFMRIKPFLMNLTSNDMLTVQNQKGDLSQEYVATWHDVMQPKLNGVFKYYNVSKLFFLFSRETTNFCYIPK